MGSHSVLLCLYWYFLAAGGAKPVPSHGDAACASRVSSLCSSPWTLREQWALPAQPAPAVPGTGSQQLLRRVFIFLGGSTALGRNFISHFGSLSPLRHVFRNIIEAYK